MRPSRSNSSVQMANKLNGQQSPLRSHMSDPRFMPKGPSKINPIPVKREFSDNVKRLIRKVRFRVKLFLSLRKTGRESDLLNNFVDPAYRRLVKILRNHYRSNDSAKQILEYIKSLPFFSKFINDLGDVSDTALLQLCKHLKYESVPGDRCIFRENDMSNDKFYVIIKGSVSIVKKKDNNVFQQENEKRNGSKTNTLTMLNESPEPENPENNKANTLAHLISTLGVKLKDMKEGEGFGEKALVEESAKRTTSVVTNTFCEFIVIMKKDYLDIIKRYDKRRQAKTEFMKNQIPYLNTINSSNIWEDLFYLIKDVDHSHGSAIVHEKEIGNRILFVVTGYCQLEKEIIFQDKNNHHEYEPVKATKIIAKFGSGSCLGEEILLSKGAKYNYTIRVQSAVANIFYVEKDAFLKRFPPDTIKAVIESFFAKEYVHKQKIKKLSQELHEESSENQQNKINFKTNQIFRYVQPGSFAQMRKKIQSTQMKNSDSEKSLFQKAFNYSSSELTAVAERDDPKLDSHNLLDMKLQLDNFLRNTIRKKPNKFKFLKKVESTPQFAPNNSTTSVFPKPEDTKPSSKFKDSKLTPGNLKDNNISAFHSNPEWNFRKTACFKRMEHLDRDVKSPSECLDSANDDLDPIKLISQKFDFGKNFVFRQTPKAKKSVERRGDHEREITPIQILAQTIKNRNTLKDDRPEPTTPPPDSDNHVNYHLLSTFRRRTAAKPAPLQNTKTKFAASQEIPRSPSSNLRLDYTTTETPKTSSFFRPQNSFQKESSSFLTSLKPAGEDDYSFRKYELSNWETKIDKSPANSQHQQNSSVRLSKKPRINTTTTTSTVNTSLVHDQLFLQTQMAKLGHEIISNTRNTSLPITKSRSASRTKVKFYLSKKKYDHFRPEY